MSDYNQRLLTRKLLDIWRGTLRDAKRTDFYGRCDLFVFGINHLLRNFTRLLVGILGRVNGHFLAGGDKNYIKNKFHWLAPAVLALITIAQPVTVAMADDSTKDESTRNGGFFFEREDGWHWYKSTPLPEEADPEELMLSPPAQPGVAPMSPAPLSAEWVRTMLPKLRDIAIDSPTRENVGAYFYLQRIMMDKAQRFSDVAQSVVQNDPLLDENLRLPFASAAKATVLGAASDAKKEILNTLADETALWFFFDSSCSHCVDQIGPINKLAREHSITVEVIHKQGEAVAGLDPAIKVRKSNGHFEELGVNFTPAIMLVRPPDKMWLISQGFTAHDALVDRIVAAANEYGLIDQEQYYAARPMAKGVLDAEQITDDSIDWNDPSDWLPVVQKQIISTYGLDIPAGEENED